MKMRLALYGDDRNSERRFGNAKSPGLSPDLENLDRDEVSTLVGCCRNSS